MDILEERNWESVEMLMIYLDNLLNKCEVIREACLNMIMARRRSNT